VRMLLKLYPVVQDNCDLPSQIQLGTRSYGRISGTPALRFPP